MANRIIIADAGPLIAFGRIKHLSLLSETLGDIIAPVSVLSECLSNTSRPGAKEILEAVENGLIKSYKDINTHQYQNLFEILGVGEATAIILACQLKAGLLIDDKLGRQTAQKMNLKIIGTVGVLLLAKEKKLIKIITPLIQDLKNAGYFLSEELIKTVMMRSNEKINCNSNTK